MRKLFIDMVIVALVVLGVSAISRADHFELRTTCVNGRCYTTQVLVQDLPKPADLKSKTPPQSSTAPKTVVAVKAATVSPSTTVVKSKTTVATHSGIHPVRSTVGWFQAHQPVRSVAREAVEALAAVGSRGLCAMQNMGYQTVHRVKVFSRSRCN